MAEPLQAFTLPSFLNGGNGIAHWAVYIILIFWAIYTLVVIYHWLAYSSAPRLAWPAIITHLAISALLIIFLLSGTFPL